MYAAGHAHVGVMLIRFPAGTRSSVGAAVVEAVRTFGERLIGAFTVVEPGRGPPGTSTTRLTASDVAVWHSVALWPYQAPRWATA